MTEKEKHEVLARHTKEELVKNALKDVLRLVNLAREALDMQPLVDLPLGEMCDADACPLYHALPGVRTMDPEHPLFWPSLDQDAEAKVAAAWGVELDEEEEVPMPAAFGWFIDEFDNGRLPQYALPDPDDELEGDGEGEGGEEEED